MLHAKCRPTGSISSAQNVMAATADIGSTAAGSNHGGPESVSDLPEERTWRAVPAASNRTAAASTFLSLWPAALCSPGLPLAEAPPSVGTPDQESWQPMRAIQCVLGFWAPDDILLPQLSAFGLLTLNYLRGGRCFSHQFSPSRRVFFQASIIFTSAFTWEQHRYQWSARADKLKLMHSESTFGVCSGIQSLRGRRVACLSTLARIQPRDNLRRMHLARLPCIFWSVFPCLPH